MKLHLKQREFVKIYETAKPPNANRQTPNAKRISRKPLANRPETKNLQRNFDGDPPLYPSPRGISSGG
jgi:hypothetical protein